MAEIVDWDPDQLIRAAERELAAGAWREAVELLRRALVLDDEHPHAHAMLALALLVPGRVHGAEAEARRALALASGSPYCHYALAAAAFARGRLDEAWASCAIALGGGLELGAQVDGEIVVHVLGAKIRRAQHELELARELIERAIAWQPRRASTRVEAARLELAAGRLEVAASHADAALREAGTDLHANLVAGQIDLARGDLAGAERHARFALFQDAGEPEVLRLWTAIQAARQPVAGGAWRTAGWLATRDEAQQTTLLVVSFVGYQLLEILANAAGWPVLQARLIWVWLACLVVIYGTPMALAKLAARGDG